MIDTDARLEELLPRVREAEWVAIDTEADSLHAYPEKLCLLQISLPGQDELVDTLAGLDVTRLLEALAERQLILHGADYDLRLLYRTFRFVPASIFDTMWAARVLGYTEFGLMHLVSRHLGVNLEKGPQKMNWARRPLTERMMVYARNDTHYLKPLSDHLTEELKTKGRLDWFREICERVISDAVEPADGEPEDLWRIRRSDRLNTLGLAVLRELWHWREHEAIAANKPPFFILSHEAMVDLAESLSRNRPLSEVLPKTLQAKRASRLVEAVKRAFALAPAAYPSVRKQVVTRLTQAQQQTFEDLRRRRDARAAELQIDPTMIASKAILFCLARDSKAKADLMRWQRELLGLD